MLMTHPLPEIAAQEAILADLDEGEREMLSAFACGKWSKRERAGLPPSEGGERSQPLTDRFLIDVDGLRVFGDQVLAAYLIARRLVSTLNLHQLTGPEFRESLTNSRTSSPT